MGFKSQIWVPIHITSMSLLCSCSYFSGEQKGRAYLNSNKVLPTHWKSICSATKEGKKEKLERKNNQRPVQKRPHANVPTLHPPLRPEHIICQAITLNLSYFCNKEFAALLDEVSGAQVYEPVAFHCSSWTISSNLKDASVQQNQNVYPFLVVFFWELNQSRDNLSRICCSKKG